MKKSIRELNIDAKIQLLTEFFNEFGRVPKSREEYKGYVIGQIWYNIKKGNFKISKDKKAILEDIGYDFNILTFKERSDNRIKVLIDFYNEFGREPKCNEIYRGTRPYGFISGIRQEIVKLSDTEKKTLTDLGYRLYPGVVQEDVRKKVRLLIEFYELYHREPKRNDIYQGVKIGVFLENLKQGHINVRFKDCQSLVKAGIKIF